jgi:hypothetical protein
MIKDREFRNNRRIRAACAILPLLAAILMQSREDDSTLKKRSVGINAGHGGGLFLIWSSAALRLRGSRKVRPPGTGTLQAARSRSNPRRCGAPALVPPPLIGRHRSQCSWDAPVTPSNGVSSNACNASLNGDQPYYQALAGSTTLCSIHSASNYYHLPLLMREDLSSMVRVEADGHGSSSASMAGQE